jgi:DNA-binding transcriptional regulator YiaG
MNNQRCDCGGTLRPARLKNVDLKIYFGVQAVALQADGLVCDQCGWSVLPAPTITALEHQLAARVLEMPERLPPVLLCFLRVYLNLTQKELAGRMGITRKTVNQWETRGAISPQHDLILRMLAYTKLEQAYRPQLAVLDHVRMAPAKTRRPSIVLDRAA